MRQRVFVAVFTVLILFSVFDHALAAPLELNVTTNRPWYDLGESVVVKGNLTLEGSPVSDGLIAIEVYAPTGLQILVRTRNTGSDPAQPWPIEITQFYPCDASGHPQTSVNVGGYIGFKVGIRNNALVSYDVIVPVYIQYSNGVPFDTFLIYNATLGPGKEDNSTTYPIEIPSIAPLGPASVYASALTNWPVENGFAYCPEKGTTFQITASAAATHATEDDRLASIMSVGEFSLSFSVSSHGGVLGNYTVHGATKYSFYIDTNSTIFTIKLITDITGRFGVPDGKTDIRDLALVSSCFGSYPGHPKWDPRADITGPTYGVPDGLIDIRDVSIVSADFGKYGVIP